MNDITLGGVVSWPVSQGGRGIGTKRAGSSLEGLTVGNQPGSKGEGEWSGRTERSEDVKK